MVKNTPADAGDTRDTGPIPGSGRSPGGRDGNPLPCSCLENPHGQRSLAGYSPWSCKELDMAAGPTCAQRAMRVSATSLRTKDNLDPSSSLCGIHSCVCVLLLLGFPGGASGKELACRCRRCKRREFNPWVWKIPWRRARQPTPVFLPGEAHGQRSLVGYSL